MTDHTQPDASPPLMTEQEQNRVRELVGSRPDFHLLQGKAPVVAYIRRLERVALTLETRLKAAEDAAYRRGVEAAIQWHHERVGKFDERGHVHAINGLRDALLPTDQSGAE